MKLMRSLVLCFIVLSFTSCAMFSRKREPEPAPASARQSFEQAKKERANKKTQLALTRLKQVVTSVPNSDIADDAYMLMGQIYFEKKSYLPAYENFVSIPNSDVFSPNEAEALYWAARSLTELGRFDEALGLTNKTLKIQNIAGELKIDIHQLRYKLQSQLGERLDAVKTLVLLTRDDATKKDKYLSLIHDYIETRLNDKELEEVASNSDFSQFRGHASFRVGIAFYEKQELGSARRYLGQVANYLPDSELSRRADEILLQMDARQKVSPRTIGVVLPLTGKQARYAQQTLRGIQLGLGIYGREQSNFRLAVIDSEGRPDLARSAVERLVTEDHVIAIIGSLLSKEADAVASKANELGVPSIGLSQKSGLTEIGEYVFRNALTSQMQVTEVVRNAMEIQGLRKFAILFPNDQYGVDFANLFWDEVLARGGQVVGVQTYDSKNKKYGEAIQKLIGTYYMEDRNDEYLAAVKGWYREQKVITSRLTPPEDLLKPIVSFEAIFIPEEIKTASQIASTLVYNDIKDIKLLGTNLWNDRAFVKRGDKAVENAIFVDSFLNDDPTFIKSNFYREFFTVFAEKPGFLESQAYDAALALRQVIAGGESSRSGLRDQLASLKNFSGSIGPLTVTPYREFNRPLVPLTIREGQVVRFTEENKTSVQ